jgi:hypothetical protein
MIEKIAGIGEIGRQASSGNINPRRLELYLALERCVPGGLTLLRNDSGYFVLCRMGRGYAGNASTVIEHFFVYREGAGDPMARVPQDAVADITAEITRTYANVWLSFDNLAPNGHALDTTDLAYNLLPITGSSYQDYIGGLGSDRRRALEKALRQTERAGEEIVQDRAAIRACLSTLVAEHTRSRYGADSLLEQEATRAEIFASIDVFPSQMRLTREGERYAFLLSTEIDGSLYVPLVGGTDPFMIKRAYHALIQSAFAQAGRIREVDAASDYPFLKRQMGFAPQSFHAVLQGDPEWRHYVM